MTAVFRFFSSIKLTVVCLLWLTVLVVWGTIYQKYHGIYEAQDFFFNPLFLFKYTPLPGGMLVMGLLFLNLLTSFFVHYQAGWRMPGLMLTHVGLIMLLLGGLVTRITGIEARVRLLEGQGTNMAFSITEWEIYQVTALTQYREVEAVYLDEIGKRDRIKFQDSDIQLTVRELQINSRGVPSQEQTVPGLKSPSRFSALQPLKKDKEPFKNIPGVRLQVEGSKDVQELLIWGADSLPAKVEQEDGTAVYIGLRRRRYEIPFMRLLEFEHIYHPGSQVPKEFRSRVELELGEDRQRSVDIHMNHPLRLNGWTFFQHSFNAEQATEMSEFAATRNSGRLIAYWATGITSVGLALHFLQVQWMQLQRAKKKEESA